MKRFAAPSPRPIPEGEDWVPLPGWRGTLKVHLGDALPHHDLRGEDPGDLIRTRAAMLWPSAADAEMRRRYFAADLTNGLVYEHAPETMWRWDGNHLRALLEAPSWTQIKLEVTERTKRATVAGYVFTFMFLMDMLRDQLPIRGAPGASLQKAFFLAEEWARTGTTYGDGTRMLASEKSIKDCWREYRSVAHFWAAVEMNKVAQYAPPQQVMSTEHFAKFIRAASYLQMFGTSFALTNKSKRASETLLESHATWLIDTAEHRPTIMLPVDNSVFADAPFMVMLKKYSG